MTIRIALIGDYSGDVIAHQAIPKALAIEGAVRNVLIRPEWLHTDDIMSSDLSKFDGIWCVPASPYANAENAILGIRFARENSIPFLGTCGGYQHALVEYARNVLGFDEAGITEIDPECKMPLVSSLTCAMVETSERITPVANGLIGGDPMDVMYHCSFGINPDYVDIFENSDMQVAAYGGDNLVRAMALGNHPFFLGCAFQPERAALNSERNPVVVSYLNAVVAGKRTGA